jgi:pyrophosphatase PpaX
MYKYILLDFDGTIAKTLDLWLNTYKELLRERNLFIPKDLDIVNKAFGKWAQGLANLGIHDSEEAYEESKSKVYSKYENVDMYDGVIDLLENLKKTNKKVALLSSSAKDRVSMAIVSLGLTKYFDIVLTKDDVINGKPDPEIFNKALDKLEGIKENAIIVGDSYHDIRGGKNAGIKTVAYYPKENHKFYSRDELEKENPDYIISDLKELIKIVQ